MVKGNKEFNRRIVAVGGGKGGIGKSVFAANLAFSLVRNGKTATIVNLDLGSDNTSTLLGLKQGDLTISTFIDGNINDINDVVVPTSYHNLRIIQGSSGSYKIANLKYSHKQKIIRHLRKINADFIIVDLGSGFSLNTLDFFNAADDKMLVFTPEPTSIKDVYSFIKCAIYRKLTRTFCQSHEVNFIIESTGGLNDDGISRKMNDLIATIYDFDKDLSNVAMNMLSQFQPKLILNMARNKNELKLANKIIDVSKRFLNIEAEFFGIINYDDDVKASVKMMKPLLVASPKSDAAKKINVLCRKLFESLKKNKDFSKVREINSTDKYFYEMNTETHYKILQKIPVYSSTITEVKCSECGEQHFYLPYQYNSGLISCKSCGLHMNLKEIYYSLNDRSKDILINNDFTRGILEADHFTIS